MAEPIDTAFVAIRPDFSGFQAATQAGIAKNLTVGTGLKSLSGQSNTATKSLSALGGTAARTGTLLAAGGLAGGIAAVGISLAKVSSDSIHFETAFSGVRKTVQATRPQLAGIRKDLLDLSTEIPISAVELANIGEAAGQLGIKTTAISSFTKVVAELGVTTDLTSDQAADSLARIANITQLPQTQFENLGSTIVALGNKLAATESEIVDFGLRIAGAGKTIGLTQDQILSIGAALASVGLNAEAGGTAISTTFVRIASAVAKGGEQLDAFARVAGESGKQFQEQFAKAPAQAIVAFIQGLGKIRQEGGNVFQTLDDLGLGGIRVRDALLRSANAGDLLERSLSIGEKAWARNNALQREAAIRFGTTESRLKLLANILTEASIAIGDKLTPGISRGASAIGDFVQNLRQNQAFTDAFKSTFEQLGNAIARVWGAVADVFRDNSGNIRTTFLNLANAFRLILPGIKVVAAVMIGSFIVSLRIAIPLVKLLSDVVIIMARVWATTVKTIVAAIDKFLGGLSSLAGAASHIPGIGGKFKAAQEGIDTAREHLRAFADDIRELNGTSVTVSVGLVTRPDEGTRGGATTGASAAGINRSAAIPSATGGAAGGTDPLTTLLKKVPTDVQARESALQAAVEATQASAKGSDDRQAIQTLKSFYDQQAANGKFIAKIRNDFLRKSASASVQIAQIDQQLVDNAQSDRESQAQDAVAAAAATQGTLQDDIRSQRGLINALQQRVALARQSEQGVGAAVAAVNQAKRDLVAKIAEQRVHVVDVKVAAAQRRVSLSASTEEDLQDDIRSRRRLVARLRERLAVVRATKGDVQTAKAALDAASTDLKNTIQETSETRISNIGERLANLTQIADLRGSEAAQKAGLQAEIRFWRRVALNAKAGSKAQLNAILTLEQKRADLRDLIDKAAKDSSDDSSHTNLADLFTQETAIAKSAGLNAGPLKTGQATQPIEDEVAKRLNASLASGGKLTVSHEVTSQPKADPQIDRLIAALTNNTAALTGNTGAGVPKGGGNQVPHGAGAAFTPKRFYDARAKKKLDHELAG